MSNPDSFPLAADSFSSEEIEAGIAVLKSGRYTMGERVRAFENQFASYVGAKHSLMVNSGSSANLLMIEALLRGLGQRNYLQAGDEVLVPALAWPTTVWPIIQLGLKPVYVDICKDTLAIDLESAEKALSSKTKALFLIHVLGIAADQSAVSAFCKKHGLIYLEDCCESFGAHFDKKHVGTVGAAGSFSLFFSHHLTTMEGGMVVTDDTAMYDDLKSFRAHGWTRDRSDKDALISQHKDFDSRFLFVTTGYNVRPMEIQAAIGEIQLKKADHFLQQRENLATKVASICARKTGLKLLGSQYIQDSKTSDRKNRRHSWMNLPFMVEENSKYRRNEVMQALEASGVETRPLIAGNLFRHPVNAQLKIEQRVSFDQADSILNRAFMIGCHPLMNENQLSTLERALEKL